MGFLFICVWLCIVADAAQRLPDVEFRPDIQVPAFAQGAGPRVLFDEAHYNVHTTEDRYLPFAELLRRDGFVVTAGKQKICRETLAGADILIIANALHERNAKDWSVPVASALTGEEIEALRTWISEGGALLLIADHFPLPGAVQKLAGRFGIHFSNGATDRNAVFRRSDGSLASHAITEGRTEAERINFVRTGTGSAFRAEGQLQPLLVFPAASISREPEEWPIAGPTKEVPIDGWYQGGVMYFGDGRIGVFGESSMFTAQVVGPDRLKKGMNHPDARENAQFVLNLMRWLAGIRSETATVEPSGDGP